VIGLSPASGTVLEALARGAALAVSISGGKDSQAMLELLAREHAAQAWPGPVLTVHADLGKAEWPQTPGHVRFMADRAGVPLTVVRRPQGDLVDEILAREQTLAGQAPAWPSAEARYCTADQKRAQIDKVLRAAPWPDAANRYCTGHQKTHQVDRLLRSSPWPSSTQRYCTADQKRDQLIKEQRKLGDLVVTAMGMRAQEGCRVCREAVKRGSTPPPHMHESKRAKRQVVAIAKRLTAKRLASLTPEAALEAWDPQRRERLVLEWLPIHEWGEAAHVWPALGYSMDEVTRRRALWKAGAETEALAGWLAHPAYVMGNVRLSCSLCVLACKSDIENGARHNPALFRTYLEIELRTGYTFQEDLALADLDVAREIAPDLLADVAPKPRQLGF
jgi:hypothetical protein